jgi:DNA-binding MarR family transcriptional regulator
VREDPRVSSILIDVHVAYHALDRLLQRELDGVGVSMSEALVIRILVLNPRVTIAALIDATGLAPSTMSSLVGRLAERGLVRRRLLDTDRRSRVVSPTSVGRGVGLMVDSALKEIHRRMVDLPYAPAWPNASELASALSALDRPRRPSPLD